MGPEAPWHDQGVVASNDSVLPNYLQRPPHRKLVVFVEQSWDYRSSNLDPAVRFTVGCVATSFASVRVTFLFIMLENEGV